MWLNFKSLPVISNSFLNAGNCIRFRLLCVLNGVGAKVGVASSASVVVGVASFALSSSILSPSFLWLSLYFVKALFSVFQVQVNNFQKVSFVYGTLIESFWSDLTKEFLSVYCIVVLWSHHFSQISNEFSKGFLPYPLKRESMKGIVILILI